MKKHNKIVLLVKSKLNSIDVLISKALVDSNISPDEFTLINVLKNFMIWNEIMYDMKEEIKNSNTNKSSNYIWNNIILLFEVLEKYRK